MSAAVLAAGAHDEAPIAVCRDERLSVLAAPVRDMSALMLFVVAGSVAVHAVLVALAFVGARAPAVQPKEIAVEIVQEAQKPPMPKAPPAPMPKPEVAKAPEPVKPPEPSKAVQAAKPAEPQAQTPPKAPPSQPATTDADLQKQLAALRAEEAALKSELAAENNQSAASGKAVAVAAASDRGGDPVGYQQIVFSQLAKAKDGDGFHGAVGTAGVRFEIAETGALAGVEIVAPSGDTALDKEALSIVRRAAPFPPPPKDADRTVFANVNFVPPRQP